MSQDLGDPIIINPQETLSVSRPKIKDAVAALRSLQSGATEPSYTVAYMLWADTTTNLLKQRNAADDGWIVLWGLGGAPSGGTFLKTASFTVDQPGTYLVTNAGVVTATMPAAADALNWPITIKNDGTGTVNTTPVGADTVDKAAVVAQAAGVSYGFTSDGISNFAIT